MKIFSRSNIDIGQIKKEQKEYGEDRKRREALNTSQHNTYNWYCYEFAEKIKERLQKVLTPDFLRLPGVNILVQYYDMLFSDTCSQYLVSLGYNDKDSSKSELSWNIIIIINIDNTTYKVDIVKQNHLELKMNSKLGDYDLLKSTYDLVKHVSELDWDAIIAKVSEDFPRYGDTITEPEPEKSRWSEYDEKINEEVVNRFAGKDIWFKVDIFRNWYDYYFKIKSFEDRFTICNLAIIDNHNQLCKIERNCNYGFDDFVTIYPLELLTTDELLDEYPLSENYEEIDMEGNP